MILLIDIGNSRVKACYVKHSEFFNHVAYEYDANDFCRMLPTLLPNKPDQIMVANVAGELIKQQFNHWCESHWQLKPRFVYTEKKRDGLINAYADVQQLGVDRWLSMLACRHSYQDHILLVSFGTATTLDAIDNTGQHLGGMIIPGLELMQSSLINNTQQIKPKSHSEETHDTQFGKSTLDGLRKGAVSALISLVESTYLNLKNQYAANVDCVITGGFATELSGKLTIKHHHEPHIVLMGLNYWRKGL